MAKIFFKNLGRSLLTGIAVLIPSGIFALLVFAIGESALNLNIPLSIMFIIDSIATLIAVFLWYCLSHNWEWFWSGEDDYVDNPPNLFIGLLLLLFIFFIAGGISTLIMIFKYEEMSAAISLNEDYKLLSLILPEIAVSQLSYFIVMLFHYGKWQICWHCWRMFCISYCYDSSDAWETSSYKTYTKKENLGSITAGDRKIADITGNVTYGYTDKFYFIESNYKGHCCHCKKGKSRSKLTGFSD